jgi:stage V sporulation protein T
MEQIGIVRRIDDLGRVQLPKELRRRYRFNEGEPLEFFLTKDGVLLKKYSAVGDFAGLAHHFTETLRRELGQTVVVTDVEKAVSADGKAADVFLAEDFSKALRGGSVAGAVPFLRDSDKRAGHTALIRDAGGAVLGAVIIVIGEGGRTRDGDRRAANVAAKVLERLMAEN